MENGTITFMKTEADILILLEDKSFQIQNICRTCLKDNMEVKYSIFESESDDDPLCSNITQLTGVVLEPQDRGLPGYMCGECHNLLSLANSFRVKCRYSDDLLRKVLVRNNKSSQEKNVPVDHFKKEPVEGEANVDDDKNEEINVECSMEMEKTIPKVKSMSKIFKSKAQRNKFIIVKQISAVTSKKSGVSLENIRQIYENFDNKHENTSQVLSENIQVRNLKELLDMCCKICKKLLPSVAALEKHKEDYHGGPKRANNTAEKDKSNSSFKEKTVEHFKEESIGDSRTFQCKTCTYRTKLKPYIIRHVRVHTGEKPYPCRECDMRFSTPNSRSSHMKTHTNIRNYICPLCGKMFKRKNHCDLHMLVHSGEKKFPCSRCDKGFRSSSALRTHNFMHDNIKNYKCVTCGAAFYTKSTLDIHNRIHTGEKPYQCTLCDKKFRTKKMLDEHEIRHTGDPQMQCSLCDMKFYTKTLLTLHMVKHGGKRFFCTYCNQGFKWKLTLTRHLLKKHKQINSFTVLDTSGTSL